MTHREMNELADQIRNAWTSPITIAPAAKTTEQAIAERIQEVTGRPIGREDIGLIAAHTMDEWGPAYLTKTREQRKTRARLIRYMRNPDLTGLSGPSDEEWAENPDLREQWRRQDGQHPINRRF